MGPYGNAQVSKRTNARTEAVDIRYHYTREKIELKLITIVRCATDDMYADICTKCLGAIKQQHFWDRLRGLTGVIHQLERQLATAAAAAGACLWPK